MNLELHDFDVFRDFEPVVRALNTRIHEFNQQLFGHGFTPITRHDPNSYTNNLHKPWGAEQTWPNKDNYGVYALLYCSIDDPRELHVYLGKASQKEIGHRLYKHLTPYRTSASYVRNCGTIELKAIVATVAPTGQPYMASALEEFILGRGLDNVKLLNSVGTRCKA